MSLLFRSAFLFAFAFVWNLGSTQNTIGTLEIADGVQDGYTLLAPSSANVTYLVDNCGNVVNQWTSQRSPGLSAYLTPEGNLVRTRRESNNTFFAGGIGGGIEMFNWSGELIWDYVLSNEDFVLHHDIAIMPNGNILAIAFERISQDEALANGRTLELTSPNGLWIDVIFEIKPLPNFEHEIVWVWRSIDHIVQDKSPSLLNFGVVSDHPEKLDINYFSGGTSATSLLDWMHCNAIDYNPELDQILLNSRNYNEFFIIDHSTTTEEASSDEGGRYGKGGDLLYRWGNPAAYKAGFIDDQRLFDQHDAHWIDEGLVDGGKIFVFNNGVNRPGGLKSSIDIINPPLQDDGSYELAGFNYGPEEAEWVYGLFLGEEDITGSRISGVGRMQNGNTLITVGPEGRLIEIDPDRNVVWRYTVPLRGSMPNTQGSQPGTNVVFRSYKYPLDYPAFIDNEVNIGMPIELEPNNEFCLLLPTEKLTEQPQEFELLNNLVESHLWIEANKEITIEIIDMNGQRVSRYNLQIGKQSLLLEDLTPGMYFLSIIDANSPIFAIQKFVKI